MTVIAQASSDRAFARELRLQLIGWGYRSWMADPEEPLFEQLQDRGADLQILDFTADLGAPVKTVRALKASPEHKHRPVEARETVALDFSIGLEDFLVKNDSFKELHTRIRFVLWRLSKLDSEDIIRATRFCATSGARSTWAALARSMSTFGGCAPKSARSSMRSSKPCATRDTK